MTHDEKMKRFLLLEHSLLKVIEEFLRETVDNPDFTCCDQVTGVSVSCSVVSEIALSMNKGIGLDEKIFFEQFTASILRMHKKSSKVYEIKNIKQNDKETTIQKLINKIHTKTGFSPEKNPNLN